MGEGKGDKWRSSGELHKGKSKSVLLLHLDSLSPASSSSVNLIFFLLPSDTHFLKSSLRFYLPPPAILLLLRYCPLKPLLFFFSIYIVPEVNSICTVIDLCALFKGLCIGCFVPTWFICSSSLWRHFQPISGHENQLFFHGIAIRVHQKKVFVSQTLTNPKKSISTE